tara:strand:- start:1589 stop:2332 length:744 start_codon:yes stop_codon:yes gene_type:complete
MKTTKIFQTNITEITINELAKILTTTRGNLVAICNANTLVRCARDRHVRKVVENFTIKTADGFPVAKSLSIFTKKKHLRVDGYKVLMKTLEHGLESNTKHYFFGNDDDVVQLMIKNIKNIFPNINISGYLCPKYMEADELVSEYKNNFHSIDADIIWVSLGFPKQEVFINKLNNEENLDFNFVGIGAVFEWVAGTKIKAPESIANLGLEWILRLIQEPTRLFRRYAIDIPFFVFFFLKQLFRKNNSN